MLEAIITVVLALKKHNASYNEIGALSFLYKKPCLAGGRKIN